MSTEGIQSLDDLKKENEDEANGVVPEVVDEVEVEGQPEEEVFVVEDDDLEEDDKAPEAWMQVDDGEEPEKKYTDSDAAAIRRKYKAREEKKEEELEALRRENEKLKEGAQPRQQQFQIKRPSRDVFDDEDAYQEALVDYRFRVNAAEQSTAQAVAKQREEKAAREAATAKAVDAHYLRAHALAEKSGIKPETYQAADLAFREALDRSFPEGGDSVADYLISQMGEGSEMVVFNLGVNKKKMEALIDTFENDPNGIQAAVYMGALKGELKAASKRTSRAPEPGTAVQGDQSSGGGNEGALKRDYQKAHKSGNNQKAFDIKRAAKAKGINTKAW